jgi:hypothetical protein
LPEEMNAVVSEGILDANNASKKRSKRGRKNEDEVKENVEVLSKENGEEKLDSEEVISGEFIDELLK